MQFTVNKELDPDGTSLHMLLEAHFRCERMTAARSFCFHLLAVVGVAVWLGAIWPSLLPPEVRVFALVLWGGLLFVAIWAIVGEWLWRWRLTRRLDEHQAKQRNSPLGQLNKL